MEKSHQRKDITSSNIITTIIIIITTIIIINFRKEAKKFSYIKYLFKKAIFSSKNKLLLSKYKSTFTSKWISKYS